jgi:4-amino-4-deoxy-L-arabinose transferase-like glycosyltransferase
MRYLLLALVSLVLILPGISGMPPLDRDESRYMQASKQMVETGDYIDIRLQAEPRYKKPIGIYWLQSAAINLSGLGADAPIWNYRLVSVLGALLSVLSLCWVGTRLFGPAAGFIAGLALLGTFAIAFEGRVAKTDAALLVFAILAQGALAQIYVAARRGEPVAGYLPWLFWAAQGCGILIKGPISPLASVLTIAALYLVDRDWRWLKQMKAGRGLVLAGLICLPWLALITWKSGGAFWEKSVGEDLLPKVAEGKESHGFPPGYYVLTYGLYLWPFGLVVMAAALRAWNSARQDPRLLFLLAWYLSFWLCFELVSTKLPHYVIPAYPALLLLLGWALTLPSGTQEQPLRRWQVWLWWLAAAGQVVVSVGIGAMAILAPLYVGGGFMPWSLVIAALALVAGFFAWPRQGRLALADVAVSTAAAGAALALAFTTIVPSLSQMWLSPRIAAAVDEYRSCDSTVLASVGFHEPSLVFLTSTGTLLVSADNAARHLLADPACALALVPADRTARFVARLSEAGKTAQALTRIDGINYSTGARLALTLYRMAP